MSANDVTEQEGQNPVIKPRKRAMTMNYANTGSRASKTTKKTVSPHFSYNEFFSFCFITCRSVQT